MKKKYLLLCLFLIAALLTITTTSVNSKLTSPPAGSSGDPVTNQTCAQSGCHPSPTQISDSADLTLMIGTINPTTPLDDNFIYDPNTDYNIGFALSATTGRYGFQVTALDASNTKAGDFTVTNASTTKINVQASRQYMGHLNAGTNKNWTFKWTSPAAGTGDVTFYYAFNTAGAPLGTPVGDVIYKNSVTISENPLGMEDISDKISELNILPNPVSNEFRISFDLKEASTVSLQLFSLDGKLCKNMFSEKMSAGNFNSSFDIAALPSGIYFTKLNIGKVSETYKIVKL